MNMVDLTRLSANWHQFASGIGGGKASVSTDCVDCEVCFETDDHVVHLGTDSGWWAVDVVDDRGQRRKGVARLSTFSLAEKYLVWDWATMANSTLASGRLGAELYRQGYAPGVDINELGDGKVKICWQGECAILVVGTATIFSHIMKMSIDEIEQIARMGR